MDEIEKLKQERRKLLWDKLTLEIINCIDNLETSCKDQEIMKFAIEYMFYKMAESEEIMNDNLRTLDLYGRKEDTKCLRKNLK